MFQGAQQLYTEHIPEVSIRLTFSIIKHFHSSLTTNQGFVQKLIKGGMFVEYLSSTRFTVISFSGDCMYSNNNN